MENFSKNIMKFKNSKKESFEQLPLDSIKIKMKIGTKNHSMKFGIFLIWYGAKNNIE